MSSGGQSVPNSTPPNIPSQGYIGLAPPWQSPPTYLVYAEPMKYGSKKMLLKLAKDSDNVFRWLKAHVGSLVVVYVQQLGIAWTSTLSYNRRWKFLYVRVPANLRHLFEPIWKAGYPIPVVISIPVISTTPQIRGGEA